MIKHLIPLTVVDLDIVDSLDKCVMNFDPQNVMHVIEITRQIAVTPDLPSIPSM